jgi:hypothetical protein
MNHWELVREQAVKNKGTIFTSLVRNHEYQINEIRNESLVIDRLTIGGAAIFGKVAVNTASERIRTKKRVPKAQGAAGAIRQKALELLHPCIEWDPILKQFFWVEKARPTLSSVQVVIEQASDDDLKKIEAMINRRKNQAKFRNAIMKLYHQTCAVTETTEPAALIAAHISDHAIKGNNSNENGILLRADIHYLFDRGLLRIHPDLLTIHLHESIQDPLYLQLKGKKIALPATGFHPNKVFLKEKWDSQNR